MIPAIFALINLQLCSVMPKDAELPYGSVSTGSFLWPVLIVILGILSGVFIARLSHPEDRKFLSRLFMCGFLTRIIVAIFLRLFSLLSIWGRCPGFFIGDGYGYYITGRNVLGIWNAGMKIEDVMHIYKLNPSMPGLITNFDFWNAIIYSYTGVNPFNMFFINCFFGAITGILIFHIAKFVFNKREVACVAAVFATFWPSFMLWSTQNLKDPIVIFSVCVVLLVFLKVRYNFKIAYLGLAVLPIYFIKELQSFLLIVFILALLASIFFSSNIWLKNKRFLILAFILFGIVFGSSILNGIKSFAIAKGYLYLNPELVVEMVNTRRGGSALGNLAFLPDWDIVSAPKTVAYLPLGLLYAWFGPFPWQVGSLSQIMAVPETLLFYFLFPRTVNGFRYAIKNHWRTSSPIIMFIIAISLMLALGEGNLGTLFRHRAIIMCFILIFTSYGIVKRHKLSKGESVS